MDEPAEQPDDGFGLAPLKVQGNSLPEEMLWHGPLPEPHTLDELISGLQECVERGFWFEVPARDAKVLLDALAGVRVATTPTG